MVYTAKIRDVEHSKLILGIRYEAPLYVSITFDYLFFVFNLWSAMTSQY